MFDSIRPRSTAWIPLVLICLGCQPCGAQIKLTDVSASAGIDFVHTDGSYGQYYFLESMTSGVAVLDYNGDGYQDIYFLNGNPFGRPRKKSKLARNALFRNNGDWTFSDVTLAAGVGHRGFGLGVAAADLDNDGAVDLYVNNFGRNLLYHNNGDGTFEDVSAAAQVAGDRWTGGGVSYLDFDNDGDLDLFVANYIQFKPSKHCLHMHKGLPAYPSPLSFDPEPDALFENTGDGSFRDVSLESGIARFAGRSMGCVAFDYDSDGDADIVVANDSQANFLYENDGTGIFDEVGLLAGVAYDFRGNSQASMGIDVGDFNRDGIYDLFMTSLNNEYATYYRGLGGGLFEDATRRCKAGAATFAHVTWGVLAVDLELDGDQDLLVAAGHLDDRFTERGGNSDATGFKVSNIVLENTGRGHFRNAGSSWGSGAGSVFSSRGLAGADFDNDGDTDFVILNSRARPTLLRNDSHRDQREGLTLDLVGRGCNRSAIAAKVQIIEAPAADSANPEVPAQNDILVSGSSYQSDSSKSLQFGVARGNSRILANITWPGDVTATQQVELQRGQRNLIVQPADSPLERQP